MIDFCLGPDLLVDEKASRSVVALAQPQRFEAVACWGRTLPPVDQHLRLADMVAAGTAHVAGQESPSADQEGEEGGWEGEEIADDVAVHTSVVVAKVVAVGGAGARVEDDLDVGAKVQAPGSDAGHAALANQSDTALQDCLIE